MPEVGKFCVVELIRQLPHDRLTPGAAAWAGPFESSSMLRTASGIPLAANERRKLTELLRSPAPEAWHRGGEAREVVVLVAPVGVSVAELAAPRRCSNGPR